MMVYDCGSKYLLLLANKHDSVPAGLEKTVQLTQWQWEHVGKARNAEGTMWNKQGDQWIPLEDLIELISQCRLNQLEL